MERKPFQLGARIEHPQRVINHMQYGAYCDHPRLPAADYRLVAKLPGGVREYVDGDPLNRIHWMSTARRDRLMVKEFELDPQSDVWIFLDAEREVQSTLPYEPSLTGRGCPLAFKGSGQASPLNRRICRKHWSFPCPVFLTTRPIGRRRV